MSYMSGKCFVDTNILIYAYDSSSGSKHATAGALLDRLWQSGTGVLSTQVLQEFCVTMQRNALRRPGLNDIRAVIFAYLAWEVVVNPPESVITALEIAARYKISFWDALIVSAAEQAKAETLYSEDLNAGQLYGSVRVVNPFLA
jgi:predicted nucleic acid-binding protein